MAFVAVSAVVICTPGQDTALTIRNTLAGGRRGGIATAAGVAAGQAVWTIAASAGIVALLSASEPVFRAIKLAGAAYLVYLGAQSLVAAVRGHEHSPASRSENDTPARDAHVSPGPPQQPRQSEDGRVLREPSPQFAPEGSASFVALLALGFLFCSLTFAWLTLYTVAVTRARTLLSGKVRRALDAVTGVVLVASALASPPRGE